jgi:hypothetical protein
MLFGLGEGFSFVFIKLSSLPLPFVGGRPKPFLLTQNLCRHLGASYRVRESSSKRKASRELECELSEHRPVGLQLDCFYLDYFQRAPHFAGHCVAAYGLEGDRVKLVDTAAQGTLQSVPRASLEAARHAKGPMAARARLWTIESVASPVRLDLAVMAAIRSNATAYLSPAFSGAGPRGIAKLAESLPTWLTLCRSPRQDLKQAADLMEYAGTGGSLPMMLERTARLLRPR